MAELQTNQNPFQWYLGKRVVLDDRHYEVEGLEIDGRELKFRLVGLGSNDVRRLSLFDLLGLEARNACFI